MTRRFQVSASVVLLGPVLWTLACGPSEEKVRISEEVCATGQRAPAGAADVFLVTVDTLRADRLGAYGYANARTPNIDALAERGLVFSQATTPFPRTTPALASLLTGLWPHHHGSREVGQRLQQGETLAEVLCRHGWATAAISSNPVASDRQNLNRGFERFVTHRGYPRADVITRWALRLAEEAAPERPLLLWVHYLDPHFPYRPPEDFRPQPEAPGCRALMDRIEKKEVGSGQIFADQGGISSAVRDECGALYDAEVAYTDEQLGHLFSGLRELRGLSDALVILSSDHGENLGEAGLYFEHGPSIHDSSLRVPLILAGPGIAPGRIDSGVARLEDVMPTVLARAGIPGQRRPSMDGVDLSPRLAGHAPARGSTVALAESGSALYTSLTRYVRTGRADARNCANGPRFSLCAAPREAPTLHDRVTDPDMLEDVSHEHPEIRERMIGFAEHWPPEQARERSVRTSEFKLAAYPRLEGGYRIELYDLRSDPGETRDASSEYPEVAADLRVQLERFAEELGGFQVQDISDEELEALRALGYAE